LRPSKLKTLILLLLTSLSVSAQLPRKERATTCATCHEEQAVPQPATQMAHAMELPTHNEVLSAHPSLAYRAGGYSYSVMTKNGHSVYAVNDGTKSVSIPIVWAMGAQAQTWVLERNGNLYESRVSYYPSIKKLAITTGDEQLAPKTIDEAVGRPIGMDEAKACFNCHATNGVIDHQLNLKALHPGLTCERCHAGVHAHAAGMLAGSASAPIPQSLGKLTPEDLSNFCGQCHRSWETVVRAHWKGPADVRFQPYRLANSRCFNGADPRISCVACHDPHRQVVRDISYYDAKCLACHGQSSAVTDSSPSHPVACPVAKSRCASCHMPQVSLPNGLLRFTDHQIRVVKAGEPYPN
jgi:Cytochrome c554 and c-prime